MIARVEVLEAWSPTPSTRAVRLTKPDGFQFRPVQFIGLEFATDEGTQEYPMSLACSPTRPHLEVAARLSGSAWKRAFAALKPGDGAEVDGPYGHFVLDEARPAVLVAGGIGITPLKGMAEYAADTGLSQPVRLVYSSRSPEEIAFRAELEALERANPRFRVLHTLTRPPPGSGWKGPTGRIGAPLLREAAEGLEDPAFYVCGAPGMVAGTIALLRGLGVPGRRIVQEQFMGY